MLPVNQSNCQDQDILVSFYAKLLDNLTIKYDEHDIFDHHIVLCFY